MTVSTEQQGTPQFDQPAEATLMELALKNPVSVFGIEHADSGAQMVIAHFKHGAWNHMYQDGCGPRDKHLFFWITAWNDGETAQQVALEFFGGKAILSDD